MERQPEMDALIFAVLSDSLAEIRRIPARCGRDAHITPELLRFHFTVWERGVLLNAAFFLIDFPQIALEIPLQAYAFAHRIVDVEARLGFIEELVAASMGGAPWRSSFTNECLACGRPGTWRRILDQPDLPPEMAWRYERPENQIPLCRRCASRFKYHRWEPRFELARGLWGPRFEALLRWHHALDNKVLPEDWDRGQHPLWPPQFGGQTWRTGSGALAVSEPRPHYGVQRTRAQQDCLERYLGPERAAQVTRPNAAPDLEWSTAPIDAGSQAYQVAP